MNKINHKLPGMIRERFRQGEPLKDLRAEVFKETVEIVKNGGYELNGKSVKIDNEGVIEGAVLFDAPPKNQKKGKEKTKIQVIRADCLEVAEVLVNSGFNPAVLNMASRRRPGGGVIGGSGAQEENLFRRTNLFLSLYQFSKYAEEYGIKKNEKQYPLNKETGGAFSPNITVFRSSELTGYELLSKPFKVSIITVPAISKPTLEEIEGNLRIADYLIEPEKEKIRTILRIGINFNHDSLVLGAFGCGAFRTPPEHMAELFKEVFEEEEFKNYFKLIVFAIIEDHHSGGRHNPEGNLYPFFKVFNS